MKWRRTGPSTAALTFRLPIREASIKVVNSEIERVRHCVVPVVGTDQRGRPFVVGSAVALTFGGRKVLVTAEHVLSDSRDVPLAMFNRDGWSQSFGQEFRTLPDFDLAARYVLDDEMDALSHIHFLPEEALGLPEDLGGTFYGTVVGYPFTASRRRPSGELETLMECYSNTAWSPEPGRLAVMFDRKEGARAEAGHMTPPKPTGKSGGAIFGFRLSRSAVPECAKAMLIGISHTWKMDQRMILGTSTEILLPLLRALR